MMVSSNMRMTVRFRPLSPCFSPLLPAAKWAAGVPTYSEDVSRPYQDVPCSDEHSGVRLRIDGHLSSIGIIMAPSKRLLHSHRLVDPRLKSY
jgi:hypothetical protein